MVSISARARLVISAGGVVYQRGRECIEVVICGRRREGFWALPKGSPAAGEALEATARREVEEETGLGVQIEERTGDIGYEFSGPDGTRYEKRVEYYLMTPIADDPYRREP